MVDAKMNDMAVDQSGLDDAGAVAIVGMALRVPGARTLDTFWRNLRDGVEATTFFSDAQLRAAGVPEETIADPDYVKAFGVLEGADWFDAGFFDMPPREAEILDPQHRQLLECSWEALEHAGYGPGSGAFAGAGRIGVLAGTGLNSYLLHNLMGRADLIETLGGWQITLANDKDFAATRVAYKLDLRGAALNVSTACSTSLVATSMGCQSLLSYQCDVILAGGCSVHAPLDQGYHYHAGGTLSPDGHCRAFDAKAQGTLDGNGVAMVVLKRYEDAVRDGDTIHAVIRGFAVNNDGAVKVGYTAPGVEGQSAVIREAQEMADINADTIGYVETHGTGTDLGDLVEISALTRAFCGAGVTGTGQCGLGSVKTNLGHLDTAAGATSLIKTVLSLRHGQIPPSLHYTSPNPRLGLESSPFYVNAALRDWPRLGGAPRRAGVSSFGIGGTNAHVVLEEAPVPVAGGAGRTWSLLPVSARSAGALKQNVGRLAAQLRAAPAEDKTHIADVAYTLQSGRRAFAARRAVLARDAFDAADMFEAGVGERVFSGVASARPAPVVFMFPGQDAQYAGMAASLYRDEPLFRAEVERCAAITRRAGVDLVARMFSESALADPRFAADPLPLFVVEYALARVWITLGVQPRALIGYSLGEYACACLAGVLTLEDALTLAIAGARLLPLLAPGPLLAVSMSEEQLRPLLGDGVEIAMVSAPRQCVLGGRADAVDALQRQLTADGASVVAIPLGLPFHTRLMAPFLDAYRAVLQTVRFSAPAIPYVSCVTGDWITAAQATDPEHYLRLAGQTVLLARGFETVFAAGAPAAGYTASGDLAAAVPAIDATLAGATFLEIGPGQVMTSFLQLQSGKPADAEVISSLRDPRFAGAVANKRPAPDSLALQSAIARLWVRGAQIDWPVLYRDERRRRVPLPTYAFEHQRYWVEPRLEPALSPQSQRAVASVDAGKRASMDDWFYLPVWRQLPPLAPAAVCGRWLVVGAASGLAPEIAQRLRTSGVDVHLHSPARDDGGPGECARAANWDVLFDATERDGKPFDHVVYLGLLDRAGAADAILLDAGLYSLLALGQALGRRVFSEVITLNLVAASVLAAGGVPLAPAAAAVLGPLHVLPQEYPNLHCRIIDVGGPDTPALPWQRARVLDALLAELAGSERAVALRAGGRWVEAFAPYPLSNSSAAGAVFRAGGVYLITGGLGNIGLALARLIAQSAPGVALVLTTRQPLTRLAGARLEQVRALEALGARVKVAAADVGDEGAMRALLAELERDYGQLNGVIHTAGLVGQESFATVGESTAAFCERQLGPKLGGARVLETVLGERPLDFCVLCSSLSPILGGLGFTGYAAANACLDSFALDHNRRHPVRWISVNWEGWMFDEAMIGNQAGAAVAELGLLPHEGAAALLRLLAAPHADRIVLSTGDLDLRIAQWVEMQPAAPAVVKLHARPSLLGAHVAPAGEVEREVARLWQGLLGIDGIGSDDNFFELGGNSLLLTQLLAQIRKAFRLELSLTSLFERPTIGDTARLIASTRAALLATAAQEMQEGEREEGFL